MKQNCDAVDAMQRTQGLWHLRQHVIWDRGALPSNFLAYGQVTVWLYTVNPAGQHILWDARHLIIQLKSIRLSEPLVGQGILCVEVADHNS